jgi:hypothetical protein
VHILPIAAAAFAALSTFAAASDDCRNIGKLNAMLGEIDSRCYSYQLTAAGQAALNTASQQTQALGGEVCTTTGKAAMLHQLEALYPSLARTDNAEDTGAFNRRLCDAIARYLNMVSAAPLAVAKH